MTVNQRAFMLRHTIPEFSSAGACRELFLSGASTFKVPDDIPSHALLHYTDDGKIVFTWKDYKA